MRAVAGCCLRIMALSAVACVTGCLPQQDNPSPGTTPPTSTVTLMVSLTGASTGTVTSLPSGIACGAVCSLSAPAGTSVRLTATVPVGHSFAGWSGSGVNCPGTDDCTVVLTTNVSVTATFVATPANRLLTVNKVGNGSGRVTSDLFGIDCGPSCSHQFLQSTSVTLTAAADPGSIFAGWGQGPCSGLTPCVLSVTGDISVTATFVPAATTFGLTILPGTGAGAILCNNGACGAAYPAGSALTLTAVPGAGMIFDGWGGVCSGSVPSCSITMDADKTAAAHFRQPTLNVVLAPATGGSVSSNPDGIRCTPTCSATFDAGSIMTLTASAPPGTVTIWTGGCSGSGPTCTVTMTGDTTVSVLFSSTTNRYVYPLKEGPPSSRYLVDQLGTPYLLVGDTAWSLFVGALDAEAELYLEDRRQKGFNAILVELIENYFGPDPPKNRYGEAPFTGRNFATPNEAYFSRVDAVIASAAAKGMVVVLAPLYLGFHCQIEGWCAEVAVSSVADLRTWGEYVGHRYRQYTNIIWDIGGDTDPSPVRDQVQAMVDGLRSAYNLHPFVATAHNAPEHMAVEAWPGASWLNANNIYTYSRTIYVEARSAYALTPPKPFFLFESEYENGPVTQEGLRAQSYWTVLSGGFGHLFGNCPLWGFGYVRGFCDRNDWTAWLDSQGARNMQHFQALFHSRHWHALVPDDSVLTAGAGEVGSLDFAAAAATSDHSSIIVYLPSARSVEVSGTSLARTSPTMIAWWYNPADGAATQAGVYSTSGTHSFTPPGPGDWVLVLDSTAFTFPPPGQP